VGHADCAVVSSGDYTALIDAGSAYSSSYGTRTILPYIHYLGKDSIDEIYLSHLDYDHVGGLYDMLGKITISKIVAFETDSDKYAKLKQLAEEYNIELVTPNCGEVYSAGDELSLKILAPTDVPTDDNNSSMVMLLEGGGTRVLFTGDIEAKGEANLLNSGYGLSCDVLKLPHHGGKSRKTDALLSASNPSSAIASVGINDRYKHPSEETVSSVEQSGATLYSTADNGTIRVNLDNGSIKSYKN
jgi:competence protein ComEC